MRAPAVKPMKKCTVHPPLAWPRRGRARQRSGLEPPLRKTSCSCGAPSCGQSGSDAPRSGSALSQACAGATPTRRDAGPCNSVAYAVRSAIAQPSGRAQRPRRPGCALQGIAAGVRRYGPHALPIGALLPLRFGFYSSRSQPSWPAGSRLRRRASFAAASSATA